MSARDSLRNKLRQIAPQFEVPYRRRTEVRDGWIDGFIDCFVQVVKDELREPNVIHVAQKLYDERPAWATGVYIGTGGVVYGKRENRETAPENFVFFDNPGFPFDKAASIKVPKLSPTGVITLRERDRAANAALRVHSEGGTLGAQVDAVIESLGIKVRGR